MPVPQIPRWYAEQQLQFAQVSPDALAAPGRALAQVGAVGVELAEKMRQARLADQVANANVEGLKALTELELGFARDTDWATVPQRWDQGVGEIRTRMAEGFGDPAARALFENEFEKSALTRGVQVRTDALHRETDAARASLDRNLADYEDLYAGARNEFDKARILGQVRGAIWGLAQAGYIDQVDAGKRERGFIAGVVQTQVRSDIYADPEAAEERLLTGGYPEIDNEQNAIWLERATAAAERALNRRLRIEDEARQAGDRAEKRLREDTGKEGTRLAERGSLTVDWIEAHADALDEADYKWLYGRLAGDGASTDPMVYTTLRQRAGEGENVRDEARQALHGGRLTIGDFDKIDKIVEDNLVGRELPSWYRRGENLIKGSLAVSDYNPDPAKSQRLSAALDDWTVWARGHGTAAEAEAEQAFKRIVREYAFVPPEDILVAMRRPTYLEGDRNAPTLEMLDAAEARTVEARDRGEIDQREADSQAELLARWRVAVQKITGAD